jgi:hypothetical protein
VRSAATTQAVIDGFLTIGVLVVIGLLFVVFRGAAPGGPASPALLPARGSGRP